MMAQFHIGVSEVLAAAALLLSIYSTKRTNDFNKRQTQFIETNEKLNRLLLEKEQQQTAVQQQADLSANFINIGRSYRLKVFNKGRTVARNVRIEFPNGNEMVVDSDIEDKFPLESLDQHQSVELMTAVHMQSPRKMDVRLVWDDESGKDRQKTVTVTL